MASTTISAVAIWLNSWTTVKRLSIACSSSSLNLPLAVSFSSMACKECRPCSAAPALASYKRTWISAWAAIWAIPIPIIPVPTMASVFTVIMILYIVCDRIWSAWTKEISGICPLIAFIVGWALFQKSFGAFFLVMRIKQNLKGFTL